MASQSMDSASSRPPQTYNIGYAMLPNKHDTFVQPSFLDMAAQHGIRLVAVDASRPLVEQGPFDLIVHKLYGQPWRAQLEAFSALHPDVPVVDPPAAIERILDRYTMLDVVSGLSAASQREGAPSVGIPRQVVVHDAAAMDDPAAAAGNLRFPLIAKPVGVDGSAASHDLCLVYRPEGLRGLHAPVVLQEFVNHDGVLFKVYVVGDHATCVMRSSLPDVPDERLQDATADAAVPFANISLLPPTAAGSAKTPPADFINKVARELRRALGLHLINFDLIRATDGKYFILDINYCPGYSKMPGFEPVLTEFFLEMLRAKPVREQPRVGSDQEAEVPKKGPEPIPALSKTELGQTQSDASPTLEASLSCTAAPSRVASTVRSDGRWPEVRSLSGPTLSPTSTARPTPSACPCSSPDAHKSPARPCSSLTPCGKRCHDLANGRKCKHVQFRKRGPKNLESMHVMFGSAHVTGASASTPGDLSDNHSDDEVHEVDKIPSDIMFSSLQKQKGKKRKTPSSHDMEDKEERSPFQRLYKNTCSKIEEGVDKITSSVEASSAPLTSSQVSSIAEVMRMVKEYGVKEKTALIHTATLLIMKPEIRETLSSIETIERRLNWLEREHAMKNLP